MVGITTVAMESTGVYWIPVFEILDARGFEVLLVNARHAANGTAEVPVNPDAQNDDVLLSTSVTRMVAESASVAVSTDPLYSSSMSR